MKTAFFLSAAALIVCTCASGCASKQANSAGTSVPCVLTEKEVSAATGMTIVKSGRIATNRCRYIADDQIDMITLEASSTGGQTTFAGANLANHLMGIGQGQSAGVGDQSYWEPGPVLYARKGDAYVSIDMRGAPIDAKKAGPQLATLALSRL